MDEQFEPPDWLKFITVSAIRVNFYDMAAFENSLGELVEQLKTIANITKDAKVNGAEVSSREYSQELDEDEKKHPNNWKRMEVLKWMLDRNLKPTKYKKLDGATLFSLSKLKSQAPEFFFKYIHGKLGVKKVRDMIKLSEAIDNF